MSCIVFFMSQKDNRPFWLGVIGGILGIAAAFFAFFVSAISTAFDVSGAETLLMLSVSAFLFSITGIVGSVVKNNRMGGGLMVFSGILVLISVSFFGLPTFIFFLIGGIIKLLNRE